MSRRKLTHQQRQRIRQQQQKHHDNVVESNAREIDDSELGPELGGIVVSHFGTQVEVEKVDSPGKTIRCHLRANLPPVATGDRVVWRQGHDLGVVVSVEPRDNALVRPDSYGKLRIVAANIDQLVITIAPEPEPHSNLIDRYLAVAENLNIAPVILLNKLDMLDTDKHSRISAISASYQCLSYRVLKISAHTGEGLEALSDQLRDKTSIFVGQSGVGKSSIIKTLLADRDLNIKIGQLSDQLQKGRHTTTFSQLYHFAGGGNCIDSPGIREFGLWHMSKEEVLSGFVELRDVAGTCRFRDCSHEMEPGCAIQAALESGGISKERFESYQRIVSTLDTVTMKKQ